MANIYSAPALSTMKVSTFKGADHSVPEDQQKPYRAAQSENMMPDAMGEVRKRPGVHLDEENYIASAAAEYGGIVVKVHDRSFLVEKDGLYALFVVQVWSFPEQTVCKKIVDGLEKPPVFQTFGERTIIFYSSDSESGICIVEGDNIYKYLCNASNVWSLEKDLAGASSFLRLRADQPGTDLHIPHSMQSCNPEGGGEPLEAVNMLSPYVMESFCCTNDSTCVFYLNTQAIAEGATDRLEYSAINGLFHIEVLCEVEEKEGEQTAKVLRWVTRPLGANDAYRCSENRLFLSSDHNTADDCYYMLDGEKVKVNIGTGTDGCISATPVEGEDNVRITHIRAEAPDTFRKVCSATCATRYGVGGYKDRLVLGCGSSAYYSEMEDPLYIADINYITVDEIAEILAVDGTADRLAILSDRGVYFAAASVMDTTEDVGYVRDALLTVSSRIMAPVPLGKGSVSVLGGELVYLSKEGVIALASKEHYSERYAEHRSAMIDREMLKDDPQELISLGRYLMIRCAEGVWWLLDENQPNSEGDRPYSSHQYEGFRLTGMPCDAAWAENGVLKLILGSDQYYWTDGTVGTHYHDEYGGTDTEIVAWWETPWIYGSTFYRKKIFMKLGILLGQLPGADTCVKIEGKKNDEDWKVLWDYDGTLCTFGYDKIDYRLFTYATEPGCPDMHRKIKIKKALCFKLRFTNEFINQPLILREYGLDYVQEN